MYSTALFPRVTLSPIVSDATLVIWPPLFTSTSKLSGTVWVIKEVLLNGQISFINNENDEEEISGDFHKAELPKGHNGDF